MFRPVQMHRDSCFAIHPFRKSVPGRFQEKIAEAVARYIVFLRGGYAQSVLVDIRIRGEAGGDSETRFPRILPAADY